MLLHVVGSATAIAQVPTWTLSASPTLVIEEFADTVRFDRIVGATEFSDGSIAVGDESLLRVMYFSREGKPVRSVGRRGGGPGEFQTLVWIGRCNGDSLFVFDPAQDRITQYDARGVFRGVRRAAPLGPTDYSRKLGPVPYSVQCGKAGGAAIVGWPHQLPPSKPGPHRGTASVVVAEEMSGKYRMLGDFAGPERYRFETSDGPRPFGKTIHVAVSAHRVFVGTADSFFVEIFDHRGAKKGRIFREAPLRELRAPDREFHLDDIFRGRRDEQRKNRMRRAGEESVFPKRLPAYSSFLVDDRNQLWIEEAFAASDRSRRWRAFSEDGGEVGSLETPSRFTLLELNSTHALGKWTDEDGVQSVRRFAITQR